ncbi:DUF397 domain-containing protein [Streptomyces sp. 4N509B]|uniref:DUF397 domain-containing protein n=1 Tax=Streptomyces sp. 4N509B TaxID=3457413 RepID=UPI003FD0CDD4
MSDLEWQKSSLSSGNLNGDCVELAAAPQGAVWLRESDAPAVVLITSRPRLAALLAHVKAARLPRT